MGQDPAEIRAEIERTREDMSETVDALGYKADVKGRAQDKVSETKDKITGAFTGAKDRVTGGVSNAAGSVSGGVSSAAGTVSERTPDAQQVKGQAKRAAGMAQENPLGLAIGGVAVGFLAGLLVPTSRIEDEKIGPVADKVRDQVKETGQEALQHGKEVAQQAASSAADTAKQVGQEHAQDLKDSTQQRASDVQQTATPS